MHDDSFDGKHNMLEITNVSKSFDGMNNACNHVNLYILKEKHFGFADHNEAMKTSLFKWVD